MSLPRQIIWTAVTWCGLLGINLSYTVNVGWRELVAGALVAGFGTAGVVIFARTAETAFRIRPRDLLYLLRFPDRIVVGTGQSMMALARLVRRVPEVGGEGACRFEPGGPDDPTDAGRRALGLLLPTATPNFIGFDYDRDKGRLLYHQIVRGPVPSVVEALKERP